MNDVKTNKQVKDKKYVFGAAIAVVLLGWFFLDDGSSQQVERKEILVNTVEQGPFNIQVEGYGKLRSNQQKLLTSQTAATVDEIVLKPGALVEQDSVILRLKNPALERELDLAKQAYEKEQGTLRRVKLEQKRELLASEEQMALISSDYETVNMQLAAMNGLLSEGIVSRLDYNEAKLKAKQLKLRIALLNKRAERLAEVHEESISLQEQTIDYAKRNYDAVQKQFAQLTVRAGMNGMLQRLPVELGQSLAVGQEMALVGGMEDLVALIKVPQSDAVKIKLGQKASIDTGEHVVESEVLRVSPTVQNGSVEVEMSLMANKGANLRPQQNVNAQIFIERVASATFIQRPANTQPYSTAALYRLTDGGDVADLVLLEFGATSGRNIQIVSGAVAGESIIISDLSYLNNSPQISLIN